eukprot:gene27680-49349_t
MRRGAGFPIEHEAIMEPIEAAMADRSRAALAPPPAAEIYGLTILRHDMQETADNRTPLDVTGALGPHRVMVGLSAIAEVSVARAYAAATARAYFYYGFRRAG